VTGPTWLHKTCENLKIQGTSWHYQRSLGIKEGLLKANPDSAEAARDLAVSHLKLAGYFDGRENAARAKERLRACYAILRPRIQAGMTFDEPTLQVFMELEAEFGEGK
jgi:hypothetical protein